MSKARDTSLKDRLEPGRMENAESIPASAPPTLDTVVVMM